MQAILIMAEECEQKAAALSLRFAKAIAVVKPYSLTVVQTCSD